MEELLKLAVGALAALFAGGVVAYAVYKITVAVLDQYSIRDTIRKALTDYKNRKLKASLSAILESGNVKRVKLDVLDELSGNKECEVEIESGEVYGLEVGDLIDGIVV